MKKLIKSLLIVLFFLPISSSILWAAEIKLSTEITGVEGPILKNIQERLSIAENAYGTTLTSNHVENFYRHAPENIKKAMEPFGYFKAKIYPRLSHNGSTWRANFVIVPGPALRITHLDIKILGPGSDDEKLQKTVATLPLASGQLFLADNYEQAKQQLFQTANDAGFLKATFTMQTIRIDLKKYTATIILHLNTGPRYYFGPVTFNQNTFSNVFLQRFMNFREGNHFSSPQLIQLQQNLSNSNYFDEIDVTPDLNSTNNYTVPVRVNLKPNKAQQYLVGLGYGTYTGARLTMGANLRHLTKTGHHATIQLKVSSVLSGLGAQYIIPGQNPLTDQYTIGANAQRFTPKNGNSLSKSVSLGYVKTINAWKNMATVTYLREHYNIEGSPSHNSRIVYPSLNVTRTEADDPVNTRNGSRIEFLVRGAHTSVVSNVSFIQTEVKGKFIYSPTEFSRVLLRGDLGYTAVKNLSLLPLSLQFFAGGLDSIRGFPYSYFGPGRYLKTGTVEFQHQLYGKLSGAVFYDLGTADQHINSPMGRGVGIGLIYETPIGPIKGYGGMGYLQDKSRHFSFDFSLGPDL